MTQDRRLNCADICQLVCCIICLPVLVPLYYVYTSSPAQKYRWARRFKEYHKTDVPPLSSHRKRTLSIGNTFDAFTQQQLRTRAENETEHDQVTHDQAQSPLFQIPPEIRLIIYGYVIGSRKIHIVHTTCRKLASFPCTDYAEAVDGEKKVKKKNKLCNCVAENAVHANKHIGCTVAEDILAPVTCDHPGIGILPLLQSCREMYGLSYPSFNPAGKYTDFLSYSYTEAIGMLYADQTFSFEQPYAFLAFAHSILIQRLKIVSSIEITPWDWSVFYDDGRSQYYRKAQRFGPQTLSDKEALPNTWEVACHAIANEMEGLKDFRLRVYSQKIRCRKRISYSRPHSNTQATTYAICRPLYQIKTLKNFEVELCWPVAWEMPENAPFKLKSPSWGRAYVDY
ncbi:hypothetical protein MferCBS49748_005277 [Microsporum ferrugineum]